MMYELHTFVEEALIIALLAFSLSVLSIAYFVSNYFRRRTKILKREL